MHAESGGGSVTAPASGGGSSSGTNATPDSSNASQARSTSTSPHGSSKGSGPSPGGGRSSGNDASSSSARSASARGAVVSAVRSYLGALASHDSARACSEMTASAQQGIVAIAPKGTGSTCQTVVASISKLITRPEAKFVRDAKVFDVRVTGTTATAKIAGAASAARLVRKDGHWKISGGFGVR